ncbi:MAG: hypothetical protein LBT09_07260 [Planctomycetaceae bacterium]|jgi:hypothetical protein|nr:hypothetical protein [Planctomycetaceae bacterium]
MTHELILTSVAQGLESEGGGFCVVGADSCFPESLIENLFQISDYKYHIQSDSDDITQNPVVYSHTIIKPVSTSAHSSSSFPILSSFNKKPNGTSPEPIWHVLSRIAPSGKDYRDKPNRLAHHVILSEEELVIEGPAWLLALAGFHFTQWYTPPINFPFGRPIPTISLYGIPPQTCRQKIARERLRLDPHKMSTAPHKPINAESARKIIQINEDQVASVDFPISPCPIWQEVTGDAGWGGVLAESARNKKEAAIIYPQGMNLLPLFVEALAIVPAQFIWDTTFTTYFFDPNNNTETDKTEANKNFRHSQKNRTNPQMINVPFLWRGVIAGTAEADELREHGDILVIDLTRKPVEQPEGIFVKFAITGAENDLPVETLYPKNQNENDPNNTTTINTPTTQNINSENQNQKSESESESEPANVATPEQRDLANLKFEPNPEPANLSLPAQATDTSSSPPELPIQTPPITSINSNNLTNTKDKITPQNTNKLLTRLIRNLSEAQFYLVYCIALVIMIGLLLAVLDKFLGFGVIGSLFEADKLPPEDQIKPVATANEQQNTKTTDTNNPQQQTAEQIKAEQQKKLEEMLIVINKKRNADAVDLDRFIREFHFPHFIPLKPPTIKENKIIVPKNYSIFTGFAGLHRYGSALKLEWVSLWDFGEKKIETRRLKFNIGDPVDPENEPDQDQDQNQNQENENKNENKENNSDNTPPNKSDKIENKSSSLIFEKKQLRYRAVKLIETESPVAADDVILFPDPDRFEWEVVAIIKGKNNNNRETETENKTETDTETENKITEVKLFHIKLKESGLYIKWERDGLSPAYFYDTLRVSLGFLRFTVEHFSDGGNSVAATADGNKSEILLSGNIRNDNSAASPNQAAYSNQFEHFVQLFEPQVVSPISPSIIFSDKKTQFTVSAPLAVTPWDSLFNNADQFEYKLNLNVKVQPKETSDILTEVKTTGQTQSVEVEITTKTIEGKRRKPDGVNSAEEYFPLQVKFLAAADTAAVVWTDYWSTELEILQKKLEAAKLEAKKVKSDLGKMQQRLLNLGNAPNKTDERNELKNKIKELEKKNRELENYDFETSSRIKNLPESHKVVMNNNEIQFDYSVYLTSGEKKRELLIMTTSNKQINEKINQKTENKLNEK